MKVRATKNIHSTEKTFEQFKLTEFSKSLTEFIPDLSLSCNECADIEDDESSTDSRLSFLVKFKADKLNDPRKIKHEGLSGILLPEEEEFKYQEEKGEDSFFATVKNNHFNLVITQDQVERMALEIFSNEEKKINHNSKEVSSYLVGSYEKPEWAAFFLDTQKTNWKKYLKYSLKEHFKSTFCDFKKAELTQMLGTDPEGLKSNLLKLNAMGCLEGSELNEIRQALGRNFI
ncbi:MAG: hypothetical protein ACJ76H_00835 [Bacteriovoracaceae bacterium]